ncbi:TrmH family RNA methyltransferase [Filimonas zeae]|uniref:RNA methyltransferase n=1 Tax=Filimonas zeae TaxID=1737353 RepID=A0A917MW30_9BACT|nr:RNA methyltransferase [Filimonas zeae]MDR6338472.1 TrmH family RNA methyltransferase [Filimonas zeae]GGH68110.1 RNA methyltransferase [Filimonas zeae]
MVTKSEVKYIQSLYQKKNRIEAGVFVVEGPKLVEELLQSSFEIKSVYALADWCKANPQVAATVVSDQELEKLSHHQTPNQVLAVAGQRYGSGQPDFSNRVTLLLDGIQDPGNLGTIIRIADWFGINQIVATEDTVDLYNPKVIQSTMGSFLRVQLWYLPVENLMPQIHVPVYGALLNGQSIMDHPALTEGVLVIGNESKGIRDPLMPYITHAVTIPRIGHAESLNAAVATGIIISHLAGKR